jgi:hypothetical protein
MRAAALITLLLVTPSASTMAAVALFAANAERAWPVDEREPFVTAEALRLLEGAGHAIATDWKVDSGKVHDSIAALGAARAALEAKLRGDSERPRQAREALGKGRVMMDNLADALDKDDAATKRQLSELKHAADALDHKRQVRQQGEVLERYFRQASELMKGLIEAPVI